MKRGLALFVTVVTAGVLLRASGPAALTAATAGARLIPPPQQTRAGMRFSSILATVVSARSSIFPSSRHTRAPPRLLPIAQ